MRKLFTFFSAFLMITVISMNASAQNNVQKDFPFDAPDSPIDNLGYWEQMAERGVVQRNPSVPVKPAIEGSSMVQSPVLIQNSPDVVVLDLTGVTQSENSVFVDHNNKDHAFISNNSVGGSIYGANYLFTDDGGLNWSGSKYGAGGSNGGDPATSIGLNGRSYVGFIYNNGQAVSYSDNESSWTRVVVGSNPGTNDLLDKNHLWIDNTNSTQEGNVYDAWTRFDAGHTNDNDIEFSRSTNDGVSWSSPINISNAIAAGHHNQGVNIQCNNTGWVFAVWAVYDDWGSGLYAEDAIGFARSPNGGSSFYSANRIVNNIKGIREWTSNPTGKNIRVNSFPSMAIDVSGGPNHGHIYVVWANVGVPGTNTGTNVSVYMTKSTNGGTIWSTPSRVNATAASDHAAFMPWITCDPVSGNLYVVYYDDKNLSTSSTATETFIAFSDDDGVSWTDMKVSDVSFTPSAIPGLATGYFGDYIGISAYDGKVYPTWTDNRSGRALTYVSPLDFGGNCVASGGCDEYISRVQFGSIDNSSTCDGYADYRDIVNGLPLNATEDITVTNGISSYPSDQCGIWVDWNRDGDFDDASETISVSNTPSIGPYTASITPPATATLGECTMRVRITYTGAVDPCGTTSFGEVEDYTILLTPKVPNEWVGGFNYWWHQAANWSLGHIPTADEDVIITSAGYQPPKCDGAYIEECDDLTINTGGTLNMVDGQLTTNGNVNISGTLGMIHDNAEIICNGSFAWNSGSSANITNPAFIRVYGDWNFNSGANANFANGFVDFVGTSANWVRAYSNNCSFYNIWVHKTGGAEVRVSNLSTDDLVVNNLTFIYTGSTYASFSSHNLVMKGPFNYYGTFDFTQFSNTGAVVFDGTTQQINNYSSGSGVFNNVVFSSTGSSTLVNAGIEVMGDLTIESGTFDSGGLGVDLHGSWHNTGGTYVANGSTVTFNGNGPSSPQDVYGTSTFYNIVQLSTGTYLRFNDANTISNNLELHGQCWAYDALSIDGTLNIDDVASRFGVYGTSANATVASLDQGGEIAVSQGVFTVDDLVENGIEGTYNLISGEINLTQDLGSFPDFRADITISTGQFILNGGSGTSWWAYNGNASLTMSGGTFDFNNSGCNVYASPYTLTLNITGGTIRTAGDFTVSNPVFTPTAGLVELYSTSDASFSTVPGTNVYDVLINKSAKSGTKKFKLSERDIAAGIKPGGGKSPMANQVTLTSDVDINGNFTIDAGIFNTSTYDMNVAGDWTNNVGDGGFLENANMVTFDGNTDADITTSETFYNMGLNKVSGLYYALELMGITLNVTNNLDINSDPIEMNDGSTLDIGNDIYIASGAGLNAWGDTGLSIFVGGNWTNNNTDWNTNYGYSPGTETLTFDGGVDQTLTTNADREDFGNLVIDMSGGEFRSNDSINVMYDFTLTQGKWHDNALNLYHYFQGNFHVAYGAGAMWSSQTGNTVVFKGTGDQTVYNPFGVGYFQKVIVDKTDFAKKKSSSIEGSEIAEVGGNSKTNSDGNLKGEKAMMVNITSDLDIEGGTNPGLTINEGTLNLNGNTFYTMGDININDGGKLIIDDGALLRVDDGDNLNVNSGGILEAIGSSGSNAKISNRLTGFYNFSIFPGGTISANEATFEYMWANGVYVEVGATIDPANAFTNCTFQNGSPGYAGLLGLNSSQTLTLTGLNFPTNTNGTNFNIWKLTDVGDFTIEAATGEFMGPEFELDDYDRIHWGDIDVELDLTVMLAGPYNGTSMNTDLLNLGLIPLNQPFNSNTSADWYYTGGENVGSIPANVVDWVLVKIKDATDAASSASAPVVAEQAAFLLNDGSIVDLDGSSNLIFTGLSYTSGLFPVVWHRNHLGIISSDKLVRTGGIYLYDFTQAGSAYTNTNPGEINLGGGVWGMFGGDGNGSGWVTDNGEDIWWWRDQAGNSGDYFETDYNLDGQVENTDKNDVWFDSDNMYSQIPGSKSSKTIDD